MFFANDREHLITGIAIGIQKARNELTSVGETVEDLGTGR
jgi:hypothetical protein